MSSIHYQAGEAYCERLSLRAIAEAAGTPCYVYSKAALVRKLTEVREAFSGYPTQLCFAVKANSTLGILREIFQLGFGADIVSQGELERALRAGVKADEVVFSGVGKKAEEITRALEVGIHSFNVESRAEFDMIAQIAQAKGVRAPLSFRINPNIDAKTNPKIATGLFSTKFGLVEDEARELAELALNHPHLYLRGVGCHIGSQILDLRPFADAAAKIAAIARSFMDQGHKLEFLDMGGGLGIRYRDEHPPELKDYAHELIKVVKPLGLKLVIEPGRMLVGNMGVLLCTVIANKKTPQKSFVIVDGAMNDLIRPSMYDAYHEITAARQTLASEHLVDVVGPICETGDIFGTDRKLPPLAPGDLVYLQSAGAYGSSMSSNYNSRPRTAEVLVEGDSLRVVRRRESLEDLWRLEE